MLLLALFPSRPVSHPSSSKKDKTTGSVALTVQLEGAAEGARKYRRCGQEDLEVPW